MTEVVEKKKRGRKKKIPTGGENITMSIEPTQETVVTEQVPKKRGRKPKGGKIIVKELENTQDNNSVANVILHLKCNLSDIDELNRYKSDEMFIYTPTVPPEVQSYQEDNNHFSKYNEDNNIKYAYNKQNTAIPLINDNPKSDSEPEEDVSMKDIVSKLKSLKISLYKDELQDKKSACFWCTYEFDNPPCYIPKHQFEDRIYGYGSFCRPECAVAYLMKENIDDSSRFERYNILNNIYSKIYNFSKNIKPAPNPFYVLDKFYGNLSIQEYRKLLNSEHLLLVIDKPMTRILPELFEDNDNFVLNIYNNTNMNKDNSNSMYKVKRKSDKKEGPSKTSILNETFKINA